MNNVIVSPKMSYEQLDSELEASDKSKTITLKNAKGKECKFVLKFPGYETGFNLISMASNNRGGLNLANSLPAVLDKMVRNDTGNGYIKIGDFDNGEKYDGLAFDVYQQATEFLSRVLNKNGVMAKLNESATFLANTVSVSAD